MPKDVNEIEEEDEDENAPQSDDIWNDAGLEGFAVEPQRNSSKPPLIAIPQQYQQYIASPIVQDTATTQQTHQHP